MLTCLRVEHAILERYVARTPDGHTLPTDVISNPVKFIKSATEEIDEPSVVHPGACARSRPDQAPRATADGVYGPPMSDPRRGMQRGEGVGRNIETTMYQ